MVSTHLALPIATVAARVTVLFVSLSLVSLSFVSPPAAWGADVSLSLTPSATEISGCSGDLLEVSVRIENPTGMGIGGYQVFLRFEAGVFEPVRYDALALDGFVEVSGPAPLAGGFRDCGESASGDGWADLAGEDVVAVVGTVFGDGSSQVFNGTSVEIGRFVFRALGQSTEGTGALFSSNTESCWGGFDALTHVFDPAGKVLSMDPPDAFTVSVVSEGLQVKAFLCQKSVDGIHLSWLPPDDRNYVGYRIYRNAESFANFPIKSVLSYVDKDPPAGSVVYEIAVLLAGGVEGCRTTCVVDTASGVRFVRGDANRDGNVNLSDPVAILGHLFRGQPITCEDAGDVDDSGILNLTDAINLLNFLFRAGEKVPPAPPYPAPGTDPTEDSLACPE